MLLIVTVQYFDTDTLTQRQISDDGEEGNNACNSLPLWYLRQAYKPLWGATTSKTVGRSVQGSARTVWRRSVPNFHHCRLLCCYLGYRNVPTDILYQTLHVEFYNSDAFAKPELMRRIEDPAVTAQSTFSILSDFETCHCFALTDFQLG